MDKKFWKQFALALAVFFMGYLTFNHQIVTQYWK